LRRRPVVLFFILAFAISWVVWVPRALGVGWAVELGAFWTYGPALAAVVAAFIHGGGEELRRLGRRLTDWRIGVRWYLFILLFPLVLAVIQGAVTTALAGESWSENLPTVFNEPIAASVLLLIVLTLTDGLGEEWGWRGFALGHMIKRHSALAMSIVLGLLWAAWHLPLFWTAQASLEGSAVWVLFARLPAAAVIYTWLFQHTRGSVVAAALFHGALNLFAQTPVQGGEQLTATLVSVGLYWLTAAALVAVAGARGLDRWPGATHASETPADTTG
jgi:hypothetical protein